MIEKKMTVEIIKQFVPPKNVTLDAKFSELRQIANPDDLVILDGSGSTGNITSWSIVQTSGQPSVTLQDVPTKQYSKEFIMPDTNDTLIFDLTVRNNQTGQQDTATTLVISKQTLALQACAGVIPNSTDYFTLPNTDNNFKIPYPEEFSAKLGNSIIEDSELPQLGDPTIFQYDIAKDPDCTSDFVHSLDVHILQVANEGQDNAFWEDFIRNDLPSILFPVNYTFTSPPMSHLGVHGKHFRAIMEHSLIFM